MAWNWNWYKNAILAELWDEEAKLKMMAETPWFNMFSSHGWNSADYNMFGSDTKINQNYDTDKMRVEALNKEVETWLWTRIDKVMTDAQKEKYVKSLTNRQYQQMLEYKNQWYWFMASKALLENSYKLADPTATWVNKYKDYAEKDAYYNSYNPANFTNSFSKRLDKYFVDPYQQDYEIRAKNNGTSFIERLEWLTVWNIVNWIDKFVRGMEWVIDKADSWINSRFDRIIKWYDTDADFYRDVDQSLWEDIIDIAFGAWSTVLWALGATPKWLVGAWILSTTPWNWLWEWVLTLTNMWVNAIANYVLDKTDLREKYENAVDEEHREELLNWVSLVILWKIGKRGWEFVNRRAAPYLTSIKWALKNWLTNARASQSAAWDVERATGTKTTEVYDADLWRNVTEEVFEWYEPWARARVAWATIQWFVEWVRDAFLKWKNELAENNPNGYSYQTEYTQSQWWEQAENTSDTTNSNKTNTDNTNFVDNVKTKAWDELLGLWNRMNKKNRQEFENRFWVTPQEWLIQRWLIKSWEWNSQAILWYSNNLKNQKDQALATMNNRYNNEYVTQMLIDSIADAEYTIAPELDTLKNLLTKDENWWLTPSDIEYLKRWYSDNIRLWFYKENNSKWVKRANNLYLKVKEFQEIIAAENWFSNIKEINNEISAAMALYIWTHKWLQGQDSNNLFTLTDYVMLAEALTSPKALTWFIVKQWLKSPKVRDKILEKLLKGRSEKEQKKIKVDLKKIEKIQNELDKERAINEWIEKYNLDNEALPQFIQQWEIEWDNLNFYYRPNTPQNRFVTPENRQWYVTEINNVTPNYNSPAEELVAAIVDEAINEWIIEIADEQPKPQGPVQLRDTLKQDPISWKFYHVTQEMFDKFNDNQAEDDVGIYWNDLFGTYVTDNKEFLKDFKTVKGWSNWREIEMDVQADNIIIHPYSLIVHRSGFSGETLDKLLKEYLELVERPEVWEEMEEELELQRENDMSFNTVSELLIESQFEWEWERLDEYFWWENAIHDREILKKKWYDAIAILEWEKGGKDILSYALFYPNKYSSNIKETLVENVMDSISEEAEDRLWEIAEKIENGEELTWKESRTIESIAKEISKPENVEKAIKNVETKREEEWESYIREFKERSDRYYSPVSDETTATIEDMARRHINERIEENWIDAKIVDLAVTGSRSRWINRPDSDIDVVVELEWDNLREDDLHSMLNEEWENGYFSWDWTQIDITPILADKSWTLSEYLKWNEKYMTNKAQEMKANDEYQKEMWVVEEWDVKEEETQPTQQSTQQPKKYDSIDEALKDYKWKTILSWWTKWAKKWTIKITWKMDGDRYEWITYTDAEWETHNMNLSDFNIKLEHQADREKRGKEYDEAEERYMKMKDKLDKIFNDYINSKYSWIAKTRALQRFDWEPRTNGDSMLWKDPETRKEFLNKVILLDWYEEYSWSWNPKAQGNDVVSWTKEDVNWQSEFRFRFPDKYDFDYFNHLIELKKAWKIEWYEYKWQPKNDELQALFDEYKWKTILAWSFRWNKLYATVGDMKNNRIYINREWVSNWIDLPRFKKLVAPDFESKVDEEIRRFNEAEAKKAQDEQDRIERQAKQEQEEKRMSDFLSTIDNKSLRTRVRNNLTKSVTVKDKWFYKQIRRYIEEIADSGEWYSDSQATWGTYPNWTPKMRYWIYEKSTNKWFTTDKWTYDYFNYLTEQPEPETDLTQSEIDHLFGGDKPNAFWLKEQKGSSRINNFTNVIKRIIDRYEWDIDKENNELLIIKEPYLPLLIEYYPESKQLEVSHNNNGYDDPAMRFQITEDWKLHVTGIKQAFMEQMWYNNWKTDIKDTDELLHIRAVNLEDQFLWENTIDEDTGEMKTREKTWQTKETDYNKSDLSTNDNNNGRPNNTDTWGITEQSTIENSEELLWEPRWWEEEGVWTSSNWGIQETESASMNGVSELWELSWAWTRSDIRRGWNEWFWVKTRWEARAINQQAVDILEAHNYDTNPDAYTATEKNILSQYEWAGGLTERWEDTTGTLDEFYTTDSIIRAMWRLAEPFKKATIEEPSAWPWRFLKYAPKDSKITAWEISKISWTILKILYPKANVVIDDYQKNFIRLWRSVKDNYQWEKYDLIIWNPPYKPRPNVTDEPNIKRRDDYFIKRGIDQLGDWWHLIFVVSSQFLRGWKNYAKEQIVKNAKLIDAYRLPVNSFDHTWVESDIIVFEKGTPWDISDLTNSWFYEKNPDKVLWTEVETTNRWWQTIKQVEWNKDIINTIAQQPISNVPKWFVDTPKEELKPKEKSEVKQPSTETKAPAKKKTTAKKNEAEEVEYKASKTWVVLWTVRNSFTRNKMILWTFKWNKTDIGTYRTWNSAYYKYQWQIDSAWYIKDQTLTVADDPEHLNYINWHLQINPLYQSGNITVKMEYLERDYKAWIIDEDQYLKQKKLLESARGRELAFEEIAFSPFDAWVMDTPTTELRDTGIRSDWTEWTEYYTVKDLFRRYLRSDDVRKRLGTVPVYYKSWDYAWKLKENASLAAWMIRMIEWEKPDQEVFEAALWGITSAENPLIRDIYEEFTAFIKEELDDYTKDLLTDNFNKTLWGIWNPDLSELWFTVDWLSKTFHWTDFTFNDVQLKWLPRTQAGSMIFSWWVWQGKTLWWLTSAVMAIQQGRAKRALIFAKIWTIVDFIETCMDAYPEQEIVNFWTMDWPTKAHFTKLYWPDQSKWLQDWQIWIISHSAVLNQIRFKDETTAEIEKDLADVTNRNISDEKATDIIARKQVVEEAKLENKKRDLSPQQYQEALEKIRAKAQEQINAIKWKDPVTLTNNYWAVLLSSLDNIFDMLWNTYDDFVKLAKEEIDNNAMIKDKEKAMETAIKMYWNERGIYLEDLWIDYVIVDEAHNFNKVFSQAGTAWEDSEKANNWGRPRTVWKSNPTSMKMYAITQYIMRHNNNRNVLLLTATPFTNAITEVYNMLALVGKQWFEELGIKNMDNFFDTFVKYKFGWGRDPVWWIAWRQSHRMKNLEIFIRSFLQRFIDFAWDNPSIVKPKLYTRTPVLDKTALQKQIDDILSTQIVERKFQDNDLDGNPIEWLNRKWEKDEWAVIEWMTQMDLNNISPYLTKFLRHNVKNVTTDMLIESSAKIKYTISAIKELRDNWVEDWILVYMPNWKELYRVLAAAIEQYTGSKVWVISEWKDVDTMAAKFQKWEINVLIAWSTVREWINLQKNWVATIELSIDYNPNNRTQLMWRIDRQGNLVNFALDLAPIVRNSSDVYRWEINKDKIGKFSFVDMIEWIIDDSEEANIWEMIETLVSDPTKKAEATIQVKKRSLENQLNWLNAQIDDVRSKIKMITEWDNTYWVVYDYTSWNRWNRPEIKRVSFFDENPFEWLQERLQYEENEEIKEAQRNGRKPNKNSYSIREAKSTLNNATRTHKRIKRDMDNLWIDSLEWYRNILAEMEKKIEELKATITAIDEWKADMVKEFQEKLEEENKNMLTMEDIMEDFREDIRHLHRFKTKEELKAFREQDEQHPDRSPAKTKSDLSTGTNKFKTSQK